MKKLTLDKNYHLNLSNLKVKINNFQFFLMLRNNNQKRILNQILLNFKALNLKKSKKLEIYHNNQDQSSYKKINLSKIFSNPQRK